MTWKHYPYSPFGDIDICDHGCTRNHGSTEKECIYCDYPKDAKFEMKECDKCSQKMGVKGVKTWYLNGKCIPCDKKLSKELVQFT